VLCDAARLRQVLVNLVSNAIKFTERGEVCLHVASTSQETDRHALRFSVTDTGIGIASDALARLFSPFEQVDAGIARRYGGSGLGLAISQRIVGAMGGRIVVESNAGMGSVFSFSLDLQTAVAAATRTESAHQHVNPTAARLKILVVDDEATNLRVAKAMLTHLGQDVDTANDGAEAIAAATTTRYDLVLMDVHMPKLSGLDATKVILGLPERGTLRIVAMTASAFEEDRLACEAAGMTDFVTKPTSFAELRRIVDAAAKSVAAL
jgi:hypothetical protein